MELKWLEDYVLLAQLKNFSKAAELRNITQPAFSRRIQQLEIWVGTVLVDRSCYPTCLTPAGEFFYEQAMQWINNLYDMRQIAKNFRTKNDLVIEFAAPHNLSLTFFPEWIHQALPFFNDIPFRLKALNVHDAVISLVNGAVDLLITYHHHSQAIQLDPSHYESLLLGHEKMGLYCLAKPDGSPLYPIDKKNFEPIPYLSYGQNTYLGKIAEHILSSEKASISLKKTYETDMAEGLKSMMLAGHGVAFLPQSSVSREIAQKIIVKATPLTGNFMETSVEIQLFRQKTEQKFLLQEKEVTSKGSIKNKAINQLWENLAKTVTNEP